MDEQAGLENRSPSRDRGFESHPLRHNKSHTPERGATISVHCLYAGGIRTGVLKGVRPLHGVTGATRRREGVWPPSGSTEPPSVRLRIPTPSAIASKTIAPKVEPCPQSLATEGGGIRTGVLKGVRPLHGVTGATRRREGAWPPSGSTEAPSVRLRIPTPSANDCLPYIKVPSPVLLSALQRLVGCERGF